MSAQDTDDKGINAKDIVDARKEVLRGFRMGIRTSLPLSSYDSEYIPFDVRINLGYYIIDWLSLSVIVDANIGLFNEGGAKSYWMNEAVGGEIGFNFLETKIGLLELRGSAGTTIWKNRDYKFTYYDAGAYWSQGLPTDMTKMMIGIGVRYYDSKTSLHNDNWKGYISVGFKF